MTLAGREYCGQMIGAAVKSHLSIVAAVAIAATFTCEELVQAKPAFEVAGCLDHVLLSEDGSCLTNESMPFEVTVSGDQWQIRSFEQKGFCRETTCDGISIFHFCKANVGPFAKHLRLPPAYRVLVEPGPIPSGGSSVAIPWLAYASSTVVQTNPADLPAPWFNPRVDPNAHAYKAQFRVSANPPYLAESATFVLSQERAAKAGLSLWLNHEGPSVLREVDAKWKPHEPDGFVAEAYKVIGVTNIGDLTLPISFELTIFYPLSDGRSRIIEIYRGTNVVAKTIGPKKIAPTTPDKPIFVRDFRFQNRDFNVDYLEYLVSDWIRSAHSDDLQTLFNQKMHNPNLHLDSCVITQRRSPIGGYAVFAVMLIFPLAVIAYQWNRRRRI